MAFYFFLIFALIANLINIFHRKRPRNLPPSLPKLPIIGNIHQLSNKPLHVAFDSLGRKYGPIFLIHIGNVPAIVISSATIAEEVMKTQDLNFASRPPSSVTDILTYGASDVAFAPYGEHWRQVKKICVQQMFSVKRVQSFRTVREEETAVLLATINETSLPVNLSKLMATLANDIICRVALGKKYCTNDEFSEILKELGACLRSFSIKDFFPWLRWVDEVSGLNKRTQRCFEKIDAFLENALEDDDAVDKTMGQSSDLNSFVDVLLSLMEGKQEGQGFTLRKNTVKALINDMLIAGTDSVSTTLEWTMAELICHPTNMIKAQEEIRKAAGSKSQVSEEETNQMVYLKAVIMETLRLHPPFPTLVPREAAKDAKLHGYDIAAGTRVFINASAIARDAEYWEDPNEFYPERFLKGDCKRKTLDFNFLPFGAGRRSCPAVSFTYATIQLVIANLLCLFDWKIPYEHRDEVLDMSDLMGLNAHKKSPLILSAIKI